MGGREEGFQHFLVEKKIKRGNKCKYIRGGDGRGADSPLKGGREEGTLKFGVGWENN